MRYILAIACTLLFSCAQPIEEIPYTDGLFSKAAIAGGSITDGLDVHQIDYHRYADFERYTLHISHWEGAGEPLAGTPADKLGHYELVVANANERQIYLSGFRSLTAKLPDITQAHAQLSRLRGEAYEDDSTVALLLMTSYQHGCHRITQDVEQSVLVIDSKAC